MYSLVWHTPLLRPVYLYYLGFILSLLHGFCTLVLCTGIIRGAICIQAIKKSQGRLIGALVSILSIAFAIILFMNPFMRSTTVLQIVGIYMILYGLTVLFDFFKNFQMEFK